MTPTHLAIHTMTLKPGTLDKVKSLFEEEVPKLAGPFTAWCGASLSADRENNQIITVGAWADSKQLQTFLNQPAFNECMGRFAEYFAAPPSGSITEVVTEVGPRS